jgi:predicted enzyme related to lactoylglutathione lyase
LDGAVWWQDAGPTGWGPVPADDRDFAPAGQTFMVNFRVDDLDGVLASLRAAGVQVEDETEELEYGRFGWAVDPEGNRFELWEPPPGGLTTVRRARRT